MQNRVLEKASVEAVKKIAIYPAPDCQICDMIPTEEILLTSHEGWGEEGLGL